MMIVALLQFPVKDGNVEKNVETASLLMKGVKADLYLTPEMALTGFEIYDPKSFKLDGEAWEKVRRLSKGRRLGFGGPLYEKGKLYNAYIIFEDGEILHIRKKFMLFKPMNEDKVFERGEMPAVFEIDEMKMSVLICYELRFPELFWKVAKEGAQTIVVPAAWPLSRVMAWRHLLRARAIETSSIVVGVNRWGEGKYGPFGGASAVALPTGESVELGDGMGVLIKELRESVVEEARNFVSWRDRLETFG